MDLEQWSRNDTTLLIKLWRECRCLYDYSVKGYFNKKLRDEKYQYIIGELKKSGKSVTEVQLRKKLKTLQSQVSREKKKNSLDSGYEPKLWCFNELSFLASTSFAKTTNNRVSSDVDETRHLQGVKQEVNNTNNETISSKLDFEFTEEDETVQTLFSYISNDNMSLPYKEKNEVNQLSEDTIEVNKESNLIKEYIESFSELIEEEIATETSLCKPIRNDSFVENPQKKEIIQLLEVPKKSNSTNDMVKKLSENNLKERQEAFCKYLATELKQITNDDLFHEVKLDILQLVRNKIKHQSTILKEEPPINIKDYISFIS